MQITSHSRGKNFFLFSLLATLIVLVTTGLAQAQQIVTDPTLNQSLITFAQQFPDFLQTHPELTSGTTKAVELTGGKGKVTFSFAQQGEYSIVYDNVKFSATTPISPNSFIVTLAIKNITLSGNANIAIMAKGRQFKLDCAGNQFTIPKLVYSATVAVPMMSKVLLANAKVDLDPKTIMVNIPCLRGKQGITEVTEALEGGELGFNMDGNPLGSVMQLDGSQPPQGTLNKVNTSVQTSASQPNSGASSSAMSSAMSSSTAVATSASSPCGGAVNNDAKLVITDLANISAQANAAGFRTALQQFISVLRTILPTLSQPSQATVQKFIDDLNAAIVDGKISTAEQTTLTVDFFNLVLSTGITSAQLNMIDTALVNVLNTLMGISTAQLQADLMKLATDAQACLNQ